MTIYSKIDKPLQEHKPARNEPMILKYIPEIKLGRSQKNDHTEFLLGKKLNTLL